MHCSYMNQVLWEICNEIYIGRFGVGWEMQFTKSNGFDVLEYKYEKCVGYEKREGEVYGE